MKYIGLMRVKNEERWIERSLRSLAPLCEGVFMLDDHSDDKTATIAANLGVTVIMSQFDDFNEARDKNFLLAEAWRRCDAGDVAVMIDGDEELARGDSEVIRAAMVPGVDCLRLRVLYLWDHIGAVRVDGVYSDFTRPSVFRMTNRAHHFPVTTAGGNMHCTNAPCELVDGAKPCKARLWHYGYLYRQDRIRKYRWYNQRDPNSTLEDGYKHIVQGDVPEVPAEATLKHAGPLKLIAREAA